MAILFGSQLYPHILESYPVLSKCSVNMCWTNEQMKGAAPGWKESVCAAIASGLPCHENKCFPRILHANLLYALLAKTGSHGMLLSLIERC